MASNRKRNLSEISNDNDTEYEHHDGNWGTYIGNKRRKLINQFPENNNTKRNLLGNHIIWINGRTNPPLSELKELIISNPNNFPLSNFKNKINKNSLKNYQTHNNKNIQNKQDTVTETDENEHNKFLENIGNNNPNIESMFENEQNVNRNNNRNSLPAFSQIDANVLDSLPRDIQIELSKAYKQQLLMKNNRNNNKNVIEKLRSKFSKTIVVSDKKKKKKVIKRRKVNVNKDKKQKKLNVINLNDNRNKNKNNNNDIYIEEEKDDGSLFGDELFDEYRNELM
eukprot:135844_1